MKNNTKIFLKKITQKSVYLFIFFVLILSVLQSEKAEARGGGGHSYGGGRSSRGSSRSSGSGSRSWGGGAYGTTTYNGYYGGGGRYISDAIYYFILFCFRNPLFGIFFLVALFFFLKKKYHSQHSYDDFYSSYDNGKSLGKENARINYADFLFQHLSTEELIRDIQNYDPLFSYPLFKDFIFSLYSFYHENRGSRQWEPLTQYFSSEIINQASGRNQTSDFASNDQHQYGLELNHQLLSVDGIVVGRCRLHQVKADESDNVLLVKVLFTANYTEYFSNGKSQRYLLEETWQMKRALEARSKAPEKIQVDHCPSCGASLQETFSGKCKVCGQSNKDGQFDWFVTDIQTNKQNFIPSANQASFFSNKFIEEGTDLETIQNPEINQLLSKYFPTSDSIEVATTRFKDIFLNIQQAWTELNWNKARPFESDKLFKSHLYWIEDYKKRNERNVLENIEIQRVIPVDLMEDEFYLSYTVRIFANMVDYTVNKDNRVIDGNKNRVRYFSEYWTFIKGKGNNHKESKVNNTENCPSCGAGLKVSMSGACEYCGSHITLGQFDWVLSQIEQDEEFASCNMDS